MDLDRYRDLFIAEANEHLASLGLLAVAQESGQVSGDTINELFRHAHSLKGMAATMQLSSISSLAHAMEDLLGKLRDKGAGAEKQTTDLLLSGIGTLEKMVEDVAKGVAPEPADDLATRIRNWEPCITTEDYADSSPLLTVTSSGDLPPPKSAEAPATVRIRTALLDRLLTLSGELLTVRHALETSFEELGASPEKTRPLQELSLLLRQLRNETFQARMLPFATISERYPRIARELAGKTGKEVSLRIEGESVELDRSLLELLADPLIHLLRNAIDHGIEPPADRVKLGKPPTGMLELSVRRVSDHFVIEVKDDGQGMSPERIRAKAVERGILEKERASALTEEETCMLVCLPGFSTAVAVTETSGRGVGMDVVMHSMRTAGGTLQIHSEQGRGSCFSLRLPQSISIFPALLVPCGNLLLAVPVSAVSGMLEVPVEQLIAKENRLILPTESKEINLCDLYRMFRQPAPAKTGNLQTIILLESGEKTVGLVAGKPSGQQEIFAAPLSQPLASLRGISASCRLGDGAIAFVLDTTACFDPLSIL